MDEREEEGISLLQLMKVMFGRKLVLLIATLSICLIGTLAIVLGFNKGKEVYTASFTYSDPGILSGNYIDGSSFYYQSLITEDNLYEIKSSDKQFSSINISKLYKANAIDIKLKSNYLNDDNKTVVSQTYTITTKKKFYSSEKQAKAFVSAIAESVTDKNEEKADNLSFDSNLVSYTNSNSFLIKINYLESQLEYLDTQYDALIEKYGDYVVFGTKSISSYKAELDTYFKNNPLEVLNSEVLNNILVLNYSENVEQYELLYENYKKIYELNQNKIDALQDRVDALIEAVKTSSSPLQSVDLDDYNAKIATLTIENFDYKEQLTYLGNVLGKTDPADPEYKPTASPSQNAEFNTKLDTYYTKMAAFTDVYSSIVSEVASDNNQIYYNSRNIITKSGGINAILAVIISAVVGCAVGCGINLVLDYKKLSPDYVEVTKSEEKEENKE